MKELDVFPSEGGEKSHVGAIISTLGKLVALISAAVAVLVTFTDISFGGFGTKEITTVLAVLMISAYVIYFSLEDAGERRGEESEEYKNAAERHERLCDALSPDMIPELREFLTEYTFKEAASRRRAYLLRAGYSEEEYLEYLDGNRVKGHARRVMRRAKRIRPAGLSVQDLVSRGKPKNRGELVNPERRARVRMLLKLLPTTLCMVVTVSVALSLKTDLGAEEICEGIMKLSTLPIAGARGYISGLTYTKEVRAGWLSTKSRILDGFLATQGLTSES